MTWENYYKILNIIKDSQMHFWFSAFAGLSGFLSIQTISFVVWKVVARLGGYPASQNKAQRYFTLITALLVAFALAWGVHVLLDSFVNTYTTPLGPALKIKLK